MSISEEALGRLADQIQRGGSEKYHESNQAKGKLFCRERIRRLVDPGSDWVEDGFFVNAEAGDLPADGVVTGVGRVHGRPVGVMASDSTVKAGTWGPRTVEKIVRLQERALELGIPVIYLSDSAGARITDQVDMFPGRRHAGRIFHMQCKLSGYVPQLCILFGPSAAGGAYVPAFCDQVFMVAGNSSMYLGSPRMAKMVINEEVTLEEMGGAKMHCEVSGCGDLLLETEEAAIQAARDYLAYMPDNAQGSIPPIQARDPARDAIPLAQLIPSSENKHFDMLDCIRTIVDEGSFFELKPRFAREIITGFSRIDGRVVGIVANQPKFKGGVLFVDSADKATRFVWLCDAFNVPLLFLTDVPGFMIGSKVERQGIIRHGAKMVSAVSTATVPKICVVVRKAYGAGLYAMCGPGFEPDATLALPWASIAVMGAEAAVNAVYANKIEGVPEDQRAAYVEKLREQYRADIDIMKLASENVIDAVVPPENLRSELIHRFAIARTKIRPIIPKRRSVLPV
jgi:methylmalonyl-CoA decarboxylase subunit alpha